MPGFFPTLKKILSFSSYNKITFIVIFLLSLFITANRTLNYIYMIDPVMGQIAEEAEKKHAIILVGDSVAVSHIKTDKDTRTIAEILADQTGLSVLNASRSGMTLLAQEKLLELLELKKAKSDILILEINPMQMMRGMDAAAFADWKRQLALTKEKMNPFMRLCKYTLYLDKKMAQSNDLMINNEENAHIIGDHFHDIHHRLKNVLILAQTLAKHVMLFITPADLKKIKQESSIKELQSNEERIQAVKEICQEMKIPCLDLMDYVQDNQHFSDSPLIDLYHVHLDDSGRKILVNRLIKALYEYHYIKNHPQ